jgi:5-methylcytosine-specific restriction enzyme subunit McrC
MKKHAADIPTDGRGKHETGTRCAWYGSTLRTKANAAKATNLNKRLSFATGDNYLDARRLRPQRGRAANIALQKEALLDVFILHFCDQLHAQLLQGMIRHYVERNENPCVLRGRLRLEQQVKRNLVHKERMYCQYDELSTDNLHNQVIKHVLQELIKVPAGVIVRKRLNELLMRFDEVSDTVVDVQTINNLDFNRSTSRYKPVFRQCRQFLEGLYPDVFVGQETCLSLLFNMNLLFELYVAKIFRKIAWQNELRLRVQGPQKFMVRRVDRNEQLFLMKPDMVFLDEGNRYVAIADAKWKILDDREKKLGVSQSDLYQMAGYAMRYKVDRLALIYPKQQWLQSPIELQLQGTNSILRIIPVDVTTFLEPIGKPF